MARLGSLIPYGIDRFSCEAYFPRVLLFVLPCLLLPLLLNQTKIKNNLAVAVDSFRWRFCLGEPGVEPGAAVEGADAVTPPPPPPTVVEAPEPTTAVATPVAAAPTLPPAWKAKEIRGIYLSRYQVTNNASEKVIRDRVR